MDARSLKDQTGYFFKILQKNRRPLVLPHSSFKFMTWPEQLILRYNNEGDGDVIGERQSTNNGRPMELV